MQSHETTSVRYPFTGEYIDIDKKIADLLVSLWEKGWETYNSCEDNCPLYHPYQPGEHWVWIQFKYAQHASAFITEYIQNDLWRLKRANMWRLETVIHNDNYSVDEEGICEDQVPLSLFIMTSVRFSIKELEDVKKVYLR